MKFRPFGNRILIKPIDLEVKIGNLVMPDSKNYVHKGIVMGVGKGNRDKKGNYRPIDIQIDDEVVYATGSGLEVEIEREKYILMDVDAVIAKTKSIE